MKFSETSIAGLYEITPEPIADSRGHFARVFCAEEFAAHGLAAVFPQCSVSTNARAGTLRGLHYQDAPFGEAKLIRCTRGRVFDVAVDLRAGSPTYGRWVAITLSAAAGNMTYIPEGFAHGFQSLEDGSDLHYQISAPYQAEASRGIRWDDPTLAIAWPLPGPILSDRDRGLPLLSGPIAGRAA